MEDTGAATEEDTEEDSVADTFAAVDGKPSVPGCLVDTSVNIVCDVLVTTNAVSVVIVAVTQMLSTHTLVSLSQHDTDNPRHSPQKSPMAAHVTSDSLIVGMGSVSVLCGVPPSPEEVVSGDVGLDATANVDE